MLCQYAAMLHFLIYEESVTLNDLRMETPEAEKDSEQDEVLEEDPIQKEGEADFSRMMALENWLLSRLGKSQLMDDLSTAGFGSYRGELLDFHLNISLAITKYGYTFTKSFSYVASGLATMQEFTQDYCTNTMTVIRMFNIQ